ncbi:tRNA pseudouridine synthase 4 [Acrodontium crateriforme]|uniref:tRNA pseudouridine(55) synthase n=1 Tax=Acrodontium crateriforme TaxID=150365 RepID=A0AAQ3R8Q7_9PEZI|nr:tRNA pseudouridine synthase 4 [Acrodontium crateriforme]
MPASRTVWRSVLNATHTVLHPIRPQMASASACGPILEGCLAINKPAGLTSAGVIRHVQNHFNSSSLFAPWLKREQLRKDHESHNQKQKRRNKMANRVKIGHGGTLDPAATGVLILGIGSGTKALNGFLGCSKTYETVVLFGAATDTYDGEGKVVGRKSHDHITKAMVEEALGQFRGTIMQVPPLYSARRIDGKRGYEYAREGIPLPREFQAKSMDVTEMELVEWMDGGEHEWRYPENEADDEEKAAAAQTLGISGENASTGAVSKRAREDDTATEGAPSVKKAKADSESAPSTSETLPDQITSVTENPAADATTHSETVESKILPPRCFAPAARIRMTVTSGFYVRSFCHDLGIAVGSLAHMSFLVRKRQAQFDLEAGNVLAFEELECDEDKWGPRVQKMLEEWQKSEGSRGRTQDTEKQNRRRNSSSDGSAL